MSEPPLLRLHRIRKSFPGVLALDDCSLEVQRGEVHCLVGENGAGKSTLMNILSGSIQRDSGSILIEGREARIGSPLEAQRQGIGIIHQDTRLVPFLSVAENVFLGNEPVRGVLRRIDRRAMNDAASRLLSLVGQPIPPGAPASSLSVAQQKIVEIARALSRNVRILAMDEPSAALTGHELEGLFGIIGRLKREGVGVVYISHRLDEVFGIGDRLTVLRDGRSVRSCPVAEADRKSLVRWMVGRDAGEGGARVPAAPGPEILRVERLSGGAVRDVSFALHRGEILGLAGLVGAGRTELARLIFGADRRESGTVTLDGRPVDPATPRDAIGAGIGFLTEDRNRLGLIMQMNIRENVTLPVLGEFLRGPWIDAANESASARRASEELSIKAPSVESPVEHLSGGNRQKVVLARWLSTRSKVLMFDEPTAGIDVGVKEEIYRLIERLAAGGMGILVISSELPELLRLCDRIAVMRGGEIAGVLAGRGATQEAVMSLAIPGTGGGAHAA